MKFNGLEHKIFLKNKLNQYGNSKKNNLIFYMLGLEKVTREHFGEIYNCSIKDIDIKCLKCSWQNNYSKNIIKIICFLLSKDYMLENINIDLKIDFLTKYNDYINEAIEIIKDKKKKYINELSIKKVIVTKEKSEEIGIYVKGDEFLENIFERELVECIPQNMNYTIYKNIGYNLADRDIISKIKEDIANGKINTMYFRTMFDISLNKNEIEDFKIFAQINGCKVISLEN